MVLDIAYVVKDKTELFELLEEAYYSIYVPAFPDDDTRESLAQIMDAVQGKIPDMRITVNVLGDNLMDPEKRVIKGIGIAYYYEEANVGLLAYNAIAPEHRQQGMGKLLVQSRIRSLQEMARANGKELGGVLVDINDPTKVSADDDVMDPNKRMSIFSNWGAKKLPIDYVQPPLSEGLNYCDTMMLMSYPVDEKYVCKPEVEGYLRAIYKASLPGEDTDSNYFFKKMKKQLEDADFSGLCCDQAPGYTQGVPAYNFLR